MTCGRGRPRDARWFVVVQTRLPGDPLRALDTAALDRLLALVDLQAQPGLGQSGWDASWWMGVVLFEGWEHWWDGAEASAPQATRRLRSFLAPAWGHRLAIGDIVHGDFNVTNVLTCGAEITGVVDWDHVGLGTRAADLTGLLFDRHRLRLVGDRPLAPDCGERLVRRIVEIGGDEGLRCTIAYGAIARLALAAQRHEHDDLETWRRVTGRSSNPSESPGASRATRAVPACSARRQPVRVRDEAAVWRADHGAARQALPG